MTTRTCRRLAPALVLGALLGPAGPSGAQSDYARPGPYLGVGGALGIPTGDRTDGGAAGGVQAQLGYRFLRHLALELRAEFLPNHTGWTGSGLGGARLIRAGLEAKVPLLTGRVQPFLRTGMGVFALPTTEIVNLDIGVPLGGGVDFYVLENVYLSFDAAYVFHTDWSSGGQKESTFDGLGLDYVSLGFGAGLRF